MGIRYSNKFHITKIVLPALICSFLFFETLNAQSSLDLEVTLDPSLENAQILGFNNIGIDQSGRGKSIIRIIISNNSDELMEALFFDVRVSSSRTGTIAEAFSINSTPFSLDPFQTVVIDNNNLADEQFPGIEETLEFDGDVTPEGEDFLNDLEGSTVLPEDIYTVETAIYQTNNRINGGTLLASSIIELGGGGFEDIRDVFLRFPGDALGSDIAISNPLPEFSWEGDSGQEYRLLVVTANGLDSPEALLQSARSTEPTLQLGSIGSGSLLEFENVDAVVQGTGFQMPPNGVQTLEPGKTYYWQVFAQIKTGAGVEERASEIWQFSIASETGNDTEILLSDETRELVTRLIGDVKLSDLRARGFTLNTIVIDGQEFSGPALTQKLEEILQKVNDEEIIIEN